MKNILIIIAISTLILSCKSEKKDRKIPVSETTEHLQTPVLALGEFESKAGEFVNKEVQIKGIVDHVCKHSGKKLFVVNDDGNVHVISDTRFDDALKGSELLITGIVLEERVDEATCLQMEEDNIKSHSEGASNQEQFENKTKQIQQLRAQMKKDTVAYISNYSLQYVSHKLADSE